MLVYRLEKKGKGPYKNGHAELFYKIGIDLYWNDRTPSPYSSFAGTSWNRVVASLCLYGVPDVESLRRWFPPPVLRALKRLGYVIAVYDIPVDRQPDI